VPSDPSLRRLTVLMPVQYRASAQELAKRQHLSLSDVVRQAVAEKVARELEPREEAPDDAR
jgi:hypothetical protein